MRLALQCLSCVVVALGGTACSRTTNTDGPPLPPAPATTMSTAHEPTAPSSATDAARPSPSLASDATAPVPTEAVRARELFAHPEWIGHEVVVDVFEPLYDSEHSSSAPNRGFDVRLGGVGAKRLSLAPGESADDLARGAVKQLARTLHPPVRATALLAKAPSGLRLNVVRIEPLAFPKPEHLARVGDLLLDAGAAPPPPAPAVRQAPGVGGYVERYVEVEGEYLTAFEASVLGTEVWLDAYPDAKIRCAPPTRPGAGRGDVTRNQVRVVGYAYTGGRGYGHLGSYRAQIVATEIVYLDPKRPECR